MRVNEKVARRHRWQNRARRLGTLSVIVFAGLISFQMYQNRPDLRRADEFNIPAAIDHDLSHHRQQFGNVINVIRTIAAPVSQQAPPQPDDEPDDQPQEVGDEVLPATGPYRWV